MLESLVDRIKASLVEYVQDRYGYSLPQVVAEQPPRVELGDLAFPFCFELAKKLKRAPRQIAAEIVQDLPDIPGVAKVEVAGPGYLNCFLKRDDVFRRLLQPTRERPSLPGSGKIILERPPTSDTCATPFWATPLLACCGRSASGWKSRIISTIPASRSPTWWSASCIWKKRTWRKSGASPASSTTTAGISTPRSPRSMTLFPRTASSGAEPFGRSRQARGETAEIARYVSRTIVRCHLATMSRIGVAYDLLPKESDILHLNFWGHAFDLLKQARAIHYQTEGRHQGCWVMRAADSSPQGEAPSSAAAGDSGHEEDKIIVRSNGTVTYVGKDIAYQLWKLGLLGMDFFYRPFHTYPDGHRVMMTHSSPNQDPADSDFGRGERVYNVIDSRQSYLQNIVVAGLRALGFQRQADRSTHFSYEMVGLSPACCRDLGIQLSEEDRRRPYLEVSGRKGLGVKADELIDTLLERSAAEVRARHPQLAGGEVQAIAHSIAVGALRYFLLKYTRNSGHRFRFQGGPELRRGNRTLSPVHRGAPPTAFFARLKNWTPVSAADRSWNPSTRRKPPPSSTRRSPMTSGL